MNHDDHSCCGPGYASPQAAQAGPRETLLYVPAIYTGTGLETLEATYYYGDKPNVPEAMDKDGKSYRIVSDQLGSVRLVMDASTGEIAQQLNYDAWGQVG